MSQDRNKSIIKRIYLHSSNNLKNNQTVVASLLNLLYFVTTIKASNQYCRLFHSSAAMLLTTSRRNKLRIQAFSSTKHALVYLYWYLSPSIPDLRVLTPINPVKFQILYFILNTNLKLVGPCITVIKQDAVCTENNVRIIFIVKPEGVTGKTKKESTTVEIKSQYFTRMYKETLSLYK